MLVVGRVAESADWSERLSDYDDFSEGNSISFPMMYRCPIKWIPEQVSYL